MKPPSTLQYVIGNPVSALAIMLGGVFIGYQWVSGEMSGWLALGALFVVSYTVRASDRVNSYSAWKREWDAMNGVARRTFRMPRIEGLRYVVGIGVWVFMAMLAIDAWDDPGMRWLAWLFWIPSAIALLLGIHQLLTRRGRKGQDAVTVSVRRPVQSPNLNYATASLPAYCQRLLS